jgi:hypothetical protein
MDADGGAVMNQHGASRVPPLVNIAHIPQKIGAV